MFKTLGRCLVAAGLLLAGASAVRGDDMRIQGGGASFPAPLYAKWVTAFNAANPGVKVDYQPSGSGAGIKGISDRILHFAGSDAPMTADQEKKAPAPLLHIPSVAGPEVMIYNLPGVEGELTLDGPTIAGIYLGQIQNWDDAAIKKLNPALNLPSKPIIVAHRSDGSGTTFIFTNYLAKVSKEWAEKVGNATSVQWPVGLGGKGNKGVAEVVQKTPNSLGYVEFAYASTEKLPYATQINKDGKAVRASIEGVVAAASGVLNNLPADLKVSITDAPGAESYPICGFTYILVYEDLSYLKDKNLAANTVKYIDWCVTDGQTMAKELGYAKLPEEMAKMVEAKIRTIKSDGEALLK